MVYLGQSHLDLLYNSLCTLVKLTNILSRHLQKTLDYCFLFMSFFCISDILHLYMCMGICVHQCMLVHVCVQVCMPNCAQS